MDKRKTIYHEGNIVAEWHYDLKELVISEAGDIMDFNSGGCVALTKEHINQLVAKLLQFGIVELSTKT